MFHTVVQKRFLRNGDKYYIHFIDNLLLFVTVKEFSKSRSYRVLCVCCRGRWHSWSNIIIGFTKSCLSDRSPVCLSALSSWTFITLWLKWRNTSQHSNWWIFITLWLKWRNTSQHSNWTLTCVVIMSYVMCSSYYYIIIIFNALVLHSQGLKIGKSKNLCPEWLRCGIIIIIKSERHDNVIV